MEEQTELPYSPLVRILLTLLVSTSLVLNTLLLLSLRGNRRLRVAAIYSITATMIFPDSLLFLRIILELLPQSKWAETDFGCALWQGCKHAQPLMHALLLVLLLHQMMVSLFMDPDGVFEKQSRRFAFLMSIAAMVLAVITTVPSVAYSSTVANTTSTFPLFGAFCQLEVWPLLPSNISLSLMQETSASFRLMWELLLPYFLPLVLGIFPYSLLALGILRNLANAETKSDSRLKMSVVASLWICATFAMLHVASVINVVFDIFQIWQRLTMFVGGDPDNTKIYQTRLAMMAYLLTVTWTVVRPVVCFCCEARLANALGNKENNRNRRHRHH